MVKLRGNEAHPIYFGANPRILKLAGELRNTMTRSENYLWSELRNKKVLGYKFRRQHPVGAYVLDFFCNEANLNIELDGSQHGQPSPQAVDIERDKFLASHEIKVLRYWNAELRRNKQMIRDVIWRELQQRAPHPLPDYCHPAFVETKTKQSAQLSPSPQPSPAGRGRNTRRQPNSSQSCHP